jgi:multidrug efflux pump subunit AcrB
MLMIPTALIGVVFGHLALGLNMTMPSMVGMASLWMISAGWVLCTRKCAFKAPGKW